MDLSEFLEASRRGGMCGVKRIWPQLDDGQAAQLQAAMDAQAGEITSAAIVRVLEQWGCTDLPSRNVLGNHRLKNCSCD